MSKRLHPGSAARAGVMAAELAALGFTGPTQGLEAEDGGLLGAVSDAPRPEALLAGLGETWELAATRFKPYPCCGSAHPYVDAALELRARLGAAPGPDARIRAGVCSTVDLQCGYDYRPGTLLNAQMSLRFSIAAALTDGRLLPEQFAPDRLADPGLLDLAGQIALVPDAGLEASYPRVYAGWVEIEQKGRRERAFVPDASGSPANPRREEALTRKFFGLMQDRLSAECADRLHAAALGLPDARPRDLLALLAGMRGPHGAALAR